MMNRLPEKLVTLRKQNKLSQDDVARILNIDIASYMGVENGRRVLNYKQTLKLAKFYRVSFEELFVNDKEITLKQSDNTTTDQINLEYFFKQDIWYRKIINTIKKSKKIKVLIIVCIIILIIISGYFLQQATKPLEFDLNEMTTLSVGEKTVSYIDEKSNLYTVGSLNFFDSDALSVCVGNNFVIELKEDGKVTSSGLNEEKTKQINKLNNIEYITACDNHIIAINKLDKIYTIGENENGELDVSEWENVRKIKTFKSGTIGIDEKGYLVFTGEIVGKSQFKQYKNCLDYDANEFMTVVLKNDNTVDYSAYDDHYQYVTGWNNITKICCGKDFIAGLTKDNKVLISTLDEDVIKEVETWENIIAIDSSDDYLIAYDGQQIFGVGDNSYNQFEKEESPKEVIQSIDVNKLNVSIEQNNVRVSFEPVKNAKAYSVSINAEVPVAYQLKDNLNVTFNELSLQDGKSYVITIIALGEEGYEDSLPVEYTFEYKEEEEKDEGNTNEDANESNNQENHQG